MDANVAEHNGSLLWLQNLHFSNVKKLLLVKFQCSIKEGYLWFFWKGYWNPSLSNYFICVKLDLLPFLNVLIDFRERESEKREREGGRSGWLPHVSWHGMKPITWACALIGNQTGDLSVHWDNTQPTKRHWPGQAGFSSVKRIG